MIKRPDMIGNQYAKNNKPNQTSFKKGLNPWNKGKKMSEESKKKMSIARNKFYASGGQHPLLGKKRPDITGKLNPNWKKFGREHPKWTDVKLRPFYKSIRQLFKYNDWRKSVFNRDKFTCTICGISKVYVEADHHPKRFIDIVRDNDVQDITDAMNCKELWDISNGRTLCKPCHLKTLTWGTKKNCKNKLKNGLI